MKSPPVLCHCFVLFEATILDTQCPHLWGLMGRASTKTSSQLTTTSCITMKFVEKMPSLYLLRLAEKEGAFFGRASGNRFLTDALRTRFTGKSQNYFLRTSYRMLPRTTRSSLCYWLLSLENSWALVAYIHHFKVDAGGAGAAVAISKSPAGRGTGSELQDAEQELDMT